MKYIDILSESKCDRSKEDEPAPCHDTREFGDVERPMGIKIMHSQYIRGCNSNMVFIKDEKIDIPNTSSL